ncbi:MAG: putative phosphohydrolase or phosphomutase [Candidatus Alkanophagales archaeon MCA70_species_1]|nr:putative phosphohydrolase or phosphomutase [Candidatus Alkanophaga volatiphilum]
MRVLMVGLDGACMDLIRRWASEGELPAFRELLEEGTHGRLESVVPTQTIPAWNCLATGKNPGKIGCFGFLQKAYGSYEFRLSAAMTRRERDIWDILSEHGKRVLVLNAPNVLYAYEVNGRMVAGPLYVSGDVLTYPSEFAETLRRLGYEWDISDLRTLLTLSDRELSRRLSEITRRQFGAFLRMLDDGWDFGFIVLSELDRAQHRFWGDEPLVLRHYQNVDRCLHRLLRRLDSDTALLIVSDHGFGSNERVFLVNEWLKRRGLLTPRREPLLTRVIAPFREPLSKLYSLPPLRQVWIKLSLRTAGTQINWERTKAFSYGTWGPIYINLRGREPQGVVEASEYERLRDEIIEGLRELSVTAYRREELYSGEYLHLAPDIVVQTDDYVHGISSRIGYNKDFIRDSGGNHRKDNGTFIAWGPDIKRGFGIRARARIYDVAPTILHMFGLPLPADMDGRVLREIFEGELATRGIKYERIRESVRERVKRLKKMKKL